MLINLMIKVRLRVGLKGSVNSLASLIISGNISLKLAIENSGLSKDEFLSIASRLGYKL